MTFSRAAVAACFIVLGGGALTACAALIDIGDPGLESGDASATLPVEASTADTSMPPKVDAGGTDSAPPPPEAGVGCGTAGQCAGTTPVCCTYHQSSGGYTYRCGATCAAPSGGEDYLATLKCTATNDCPATQRCCAAIGQSSAASVCKTQCTQGEFALCDPAPAPETCPSGYSCRAFSQGFPSSFAYCRFNN